MLKGLFKKTPTVEEFRKIVLRSLIKNGIQMPDDKYIDQEYINGFEYCIFWKSESYHMLYLARCADVRTDNCEIQFARMRLS